MLADFFGEGGAGLPSAAAVSRHSDTSIGICRIDVSEQLNGTFVIAAGICSISTTLVCLRKKEEVFGICLGMQGGSFLERSDRLVPQPVLDLGEAERLQAIWIVRL